jgi:hypothetical protein
VHRRLAQAVPFFATQSWEENVQQAALCGREPADVPAPPAVTRDGAPSANGLAPAAYRPLFAGRAFEHAERLAFQRPSDVLLARPDARRLGIADGDRVVVRHAAGTTSGRARLSRSLHEGSVRFAWDGARPPGGCTVEKAEA